MRSVLKLGTTLAYSAKGSARCILKGKFGLRFSLGNITLPPVPNIYKTIQGNTYTQGYQVLFPSACNKRTSEQ